MSNEVDIKTSLGYMGEEYQEQLLKCLIEDYLFFAKINPVLDQNKFSSPSLKRIVGIMKDLYASSGHVPRYVDMRNWIRYNVKDEVSVDEMVSILSKVSGITDFDITVVEDSAIDFFKQQNLSIVLKRIESMVRSGDVRYNEVEKMLQDTLDVNNLEDTSFRLYENVDDDLSDDYRKTIPTGADRLDEVLVGGLARGELGIIIAPLGVGKTSAVTGFAANAAIHKCEENNYKGYKVMHLFFEDMEVSIRRKYYGFVTGFDASTLSYPNVRPEAIRILNEKSDMRDLLKENIVLNRWESGERSATDVENEIKRQIACGFRPDLVIVDYFECLKPEARIDSNGSEWSMEGVTMRKLEKIAHKFNVALWVPIQGTKDSIGAEYVGIGQGSGSVKKTQIGHVVITFAQTDEQKIAGMMNLYIGKFRGGRILRNKFNGIRFNNGTCKFDFTSLSEDVVNSDFNIENIPMDVLDGKTRRI